MNDYLSGAKLDVTTVALLADRAAIAKALPRALALAAMPGVPRGRHVAIVDVFRVSDGRLEVGGVPQGRWLDAGGTAAGAGAGSMIGGGLGAAYGALAGATMGGTLGMLRGPAAWLAGAANGWVAGGAIGGAVGTLAGARRGASLGGTLGARSAGALARSLGSYGEVMIAIPNVVLRDDPRKPHLFVLRMFTDSALAQWGDRRIGFGFGKQMAAVAARPFRSLSVRDGAARVLAAAFAPIDENDWRAITPGGGLPAIARDWLAQPLLGRLPSGKIVASRLDRDYDERGAAWAAPARTRISFAAGVVPGVRAGIHRLGPATDERPWGVLHARQVMSRVTYPRAQADGAQTDGK